MNRFLSLPILAVLLLFSCQEETPTPKLKKLDYYIDSYEVPGLGFDPQLKVQYEYNSSGKVTKYTVYSFDPNSQNLAEQRHFDFSYSNSSVAGLKGYLSNATLPYIEYAYTYLPDGSITKITEDNHAAGVTSEVNFIYSSAENKIKAVYTYSNGGGFEYEFNYQDQNIITDKTTKGTQLCSDGSYTYDTHVNPFNQLGYIDYTLTGFSVNNKLTEDVNYISCAFPNAIPVSYSYEYDTDGYPTVAITNFSTIDHKMERKFFYLN